MIFKKCEPLRLNNEQWGVLSEGRTRKIFWMRLRGKMWEKFFEEGKSGEMKEHERIR